MGCWASSICRQACFGELLGGVGAGAGAAGVAAGSPYREEEAECAPVKSLSSLRSGTKDRAAAVTVVGKVSENGHDDVGPEASAGADPTASTASQGLREKAKGRASTALENRELWGADENVIDHVERWMHEQEKAQDAKGSTMGIWQGVIFPCMANILGVILFLRLPWIVGKAGVLSAFFLVLICCCCTFITTLSLSAVATNGKILGGGSYYLISRSLGPALGAGVGLCFYMANSIGAAMYFMGTVEAWEVAAPNLQLMTAGELNNVRVTGFLILAVALVIVGGGIKYVAKVGTVFLFIVLVVILFMYIGCFAGPAGNGLYELDIVDANNDVTTETLEWGAPSKKYFTENFWADYDAEQKAFPLDNTQYNFIPLMGLWFPACTGIMAGSNRSADLKDPPAYIPKGTLFAQVVTSVIYLSFTILYGCVAPRQTLLDDRFFASSSAWPIKQVVVYGVIASTIGAGLTSLTSGTRLLSAIALDKTLPILAVFAVKPGQEPRLALIASGVLCACAIAIGQLNSIAPVLTMFFLMCYTCVNMSCTVLEAVGDPNWRPRFRFHHWSVSLIGAILCLFMMFAMDPIMATVAMVFCALVFGYASFNSAEAKWGDGFQGMKFQLAKNILTKMDLKVHAKNWRPQLLVITKASLVEGALGHDELVQVHDPELLKFVSQLKGGRGFVIVGGVCCNGEFEHFVEGAGMFSSLQDFTASDGQVAMQKLLHEYGISGFGRIIYTHDFQEGVMGLVQNAGLGSFQPNSVIASWPVQWRNLKKEGELARTQLIRLVQTAVAFNKVTLIPKGHMWPSSLNRLGGYIDIWWIVGDGGILLLLPFLLKKHRVWKECRTRLWVLADKHSDDPEKIKKELKRYVLEFRLDIEVCVKIVDPATLDLGEDLTGPDEGMQRQVSPNEDFALRREISGRSTRSMEVVEGISKWLEKQNSEDPSQRLSQRIVSHGSEAGKDNGFRFEPPGTIWSQRTSHMESLEAVTVELAEDDDDLGTRFASKGHRPADSEPGGKNGVASPKREVNPDENFTGFSKAMRSMSTKTKKSQKAGFLHSKGQLTSTKPLSAEELLVPKGLNKLIFSMSKDAELVVTNLPDMSKTESAFGYFQFVAAMTKDLPRVVLVRGTSTEVITAFT